MSPRTKKNTDVEEKKTTEKKATVKAKKHVTKKVDAPAVTEVMKSVTSVEKNEEKKDYIWAVGRRKSAVARVRLYLNGSGSYLVNKKSVDAYFPTFDNRKVARQPLELIDAKGIYDVSTYVNGGGISGQADAARLGLARALIKFNPDFKKILKTEGLLTRDPRVKERKKPGLRRARRAPQFSKR